MEAKYNLKHAKEILEPCGLLGENQRGKYLRIKKRGVMPAIKRDLLLLNETEGLRWRPARQLQLLPGAPEVKGTPMLPNPFTARELAAFMLEGAGALVADFYGEWDDGPDPESLRAIDPDSKARRAVTEAFTAYREAEGIVGPYPRALQADADRARKAYNEANQRANEREGVSGSVPGTDDSTARRARAVASVAAQEAKMHTTIAASRQASEEWLTKMVRCLLEPQAAAPAPVVAESADDGEAWKAMARERAGEIIKRQREKDLHPSQEAIADEIAREFRQACIVGAGGKPLTGAYIKRHALKGISSAQNRQLSTSIRRGK